MRSTLDRLRHTLLYELIAIITVTPLAALATGRELFAVTTLSIVFSLLAMSWNYIYNWAFDHLLRYKQLPLMKTLKLRIIHVIGYEMGFLIMGVPLIAYLLEMGFWQALVTNVGFILFFITYAFVYNWLYDIVFPIPETAEPNA